MKTEQARAIFEDCGKRDTPDAVVCVWSSAGDNAAHTIGLGKPRHGADGELSDEFINWWMRSVEGILCNSDCDPEAVTWFEARGVRY